MVQETRSTSQRQAFERCAKLAEHVLNTRALGETALFVRVFAENAGDGTEELYNERDDPRELINRARAAAFQPALEHFRARLGQWKGRLREADR